MAELADRTFLKPWAISNPFHRSGKELTDLLVPFGDDIILFSDKACRFRGDKELGTAWRRWSRDAIDESITQLKGALRQLERSDCTIFTDHSATDPLAYPPPPHDRRRYHLVAVVRPDLEPSQKPAGWQGLAYSDTLDVGEATPFFVGPRIEGEHFVHVLEGEDLELILAHLDTAPDLITYLTSRADALSKRPGVTFREPDLLAIAIGNWMNGAGHTVSLSPSEVQDLDGAWSRYAGSERAERTQALSKDSYLIDQLIDEFHHEYLRRREAGQVDPERHEEAMRLLAAEGRFARRIITSPLMGILDETNHLTVWVSTAPSPTAPGLRYLWLAYPQKPSDVSDAVFARVIHDHLAQYLVVAADTFKDATMVVGLAVPNRSAQDNLLIMRVLEVVRTKELRQEAAYWRAKGIFRDLEPDPRLHVP